MSSELPRRRESAPPGRPWLDTLVKENPLGNRGEQYIQARDEGGIDDAGVLQPDGLEDITQAQGYWRRSLAQIAMSKNWVQKICCWRGRCSCLLGFSTLARVMNVDRLYPCRITA